jgi:hypothetical protein
VAKRLILLVVLLLALPATALAATVKVRVEGQTKTIFGPTQITVSAATPLAALEQASLLGEFYYHVTSTSFGPYIDQIGRYPAGGSSGWVFKVDNASPPVGADADQLKDGDVVLWYWATFGSTGGPPTLDVKAAAKKGCYTATAYDDGGKAAAVSGLQWHVGTRAPVAGATGTVFCPKAHPGLLVRATATGAVRSNAVA